MTDAAIIKALECCSTKGAKCSDCKKYFRGAIDLINSQKAEIDRLKNENDILSKNADTAFQDGLNEAQDLYAEQVKDEIKSEAIKEFTERLKNIYIKDKRYDRPNAHTLIVCLFANIDNLVKEMVGEE